MKPKAVIFDMDGLLVDTEIISWKIYQQLLQQLGHDFTMAQYSKDYSGNTEIKNVTRLIQTYQLPWSVEEGLTMVKTTEQVLLERGVDLKVGVYPLLTHLKTLGYPLAIASSSTRKRAKKSWMIITFWISFHLPFLLKTSPIANHILRYS